ncbi:MAG: hypothetical protein JRG70_12185 [Deltaproteobacteria bacterium]|nr:hypothetical protein [Deltaproteobacteria bacterium]MBW2717791.1 hypothetical protein [Deltaproteobacteria bacterium]
MKSDGRGPIDPWAELQRVAHVFRYRGEATSDRELRDVAAALDALCRPEMRTDVIKASIKVLKKAGEPLTIRAQADALLAATEDSVGRHKEPRRIAADIVTELIKLPMLRARCEHCPKFSDSFGA